MSGAIITPEKLPPRARHLQDDLRADLAPTHYKKEMSVSGSRNSFCSNASPASTSPQTQRTTEPKEKDLDRIEHPLHNRYTGNTGKNRR